MKSLQAEIESYLVVIGAVGAEVGLRTEHLVHHIQAAHGGASHGAEPSAESGRGRIINPGGEGRAADGQLREAPRAAALRF